MAKFEIAVEKTLELEGFGKIVDDRFDPGGQTKWGISKAAYPEEDIPRLTRDRALELYHHDFWHPLYDQIAEQEIADELFAFAVNTSARGWPKQAVKVFQEAIRYLTIGPVVIDGIFGPKTLEVTNSLLPELLLREFRAREAYYYANIVIRQPDANEPDKLRYLLGWLRRVMA